VRGRAPANRVAQYVDLRHQHIRSAVEQVHGEEEGSTRNLIAAIIQYVGNMPELSEWRNAPAGRARGLGSPAFRPTLEVRTRLVETR
jgi:hypothetical protein